MPEFFDVIRSRHSNRRFTDEGVGDADLEAILDAMRRAPSAGDLQAYTAVVVRERQRIVSLARAAFGQECVDAAPLILVFFRDPGRSREKYGERGAQLFSGQDATIAAAHAQLAAHARGLGTVWVGSFDDGAVQRAVDAPASLKPSSLLVIGHPAEEPAPTPRRRLAELVRRESFHPAPGDPRNGATRRAHRAARAIASVRRQLASRRATRGRARARSRAP